MGWEVPGIFDVEMQVRNLSLKVRAGGGVELDGPGKKRS